MIDLIASLFWPAVAVMLVTRWLLKRYYGGKK